MELRKNRGDVTPEQWAGIERKFAQEADEKATFEEKTTWWAEVIGPCGDCFISDRGEVVDDIGNFLFRLPSTRPENLVEWVNNNFNDFLEGGE